MSTFAELPLNPQLLRAIAEMGFESPSPIQAQALPLLLGDATDFLGLAGTGTGKTAAFAIPLLSRIDAKMRTVQALILCPTRELAMQVAGQISLLGKYLGVKVATVYGGAPFGDQVRALRGGAQIVVGTPGRVIDHLERKTLELGDVDTLILDEADEMFSMGFKDELDKIIAGVSEDANTWLFSATMSPEVRRVVTSKLHDPKTVQVNRAAMLSSGVEQLYYRCQENEKAEMICKLMEAADDFYGLIFCQTKALVADLTRFMLDRGYKVDCLHGDMDQNSRERTMQAFRDKKLQVLVCTDVAARGLDVKDITHVVNYSLPREMESYVHRIGRTARSGKTGIVMNLLTFSHRHLLGRIEQHTKVRMVEGFVPSKRDIAARKVARMLPTLLDQPYASRVLEVMGEDFRTQLATMTPEDVASRFIVMMLPDIFGGDESRKTKKATKTVGPVAASVPIVARPVPTVAPIARPVVAAAAPKAPIASQDVSTQVAAGVDLENDAEISAEIDNEIEEITSIVSPIEAAQLVVDALADANLVDESNDEEEVSASAATDLFGDEIVSKKKVTSKVTSVDEPPRTRKKRVFNEDEITTMLEEPPTFGVVKASAPSRPSASASDDTRPRGEFPRSQSQFRSGPRESRFEGRGGRFERREGGFDRGGSRPETGSRFGSRDGGFNRGPRSDSGLRPDGGFGARSAGPSRPGGEGFSAPRVGGFERNGGFRSYGRSNERTGFAPRGDERTMGRSSDRPMQTTRPDMSSRPVGSVEAPARAPRNRMYERPSAPANFAKPPKHDAGPARTAREGETGGLNRRARRAALFGRPLDGATETSTTN